MTLPIARRIVLAVAVVTAPTISLAQAPPNPAPAPDPAPALPIVVTPQLDFSGITFGSFNYRTDSAARATLGGRSPNQFSVDRAYLNFRMPAGENAVFRITPDIFQNTNSATNSYYQGWTVRMKYAYVQYAGLRNWIGSGSGLLGRAGILQTVVIDQIEAFWPRYLGNSAVERNGYFASADAGVSGLLTLGNRWGEIYGTITNGPGYTTFDRDRFKDFALRATLTPLANRAGLHPILRTLAISPWVYKGWSASAFAVGGAEQIGPGLNGAITDGLQRDRYGLFAGVRERRLTAAVDLSQRIDAGETGANTLASPRVLRDSTGRLVSGFVIARPTEWFDPAHASPFSFVARYDRFTPSIHPDSPNYAGMVPYYAYWILGASYDLNQRFTMTLDWQVQSPNDFPAPIGTNVRPAPRTSTAFMHWVVIF